MQKTISQHNVVKKMQRKYGAFNRAKREGDIEYHLSHTLEDGGLIELKKSNRSKDGYGVYSNRMYIESREFDRYRSAKGYYDFVIKKYG